MAGALSALDRQQGANGRIAAAATLAARAETCGLCRLSLQNGEDIVEAGDAYYHVACFVCNGCKKKLTGETMTINNK